MIDWLDCRRRADQHPPHNPGEWPPADYALPDTLDEIERGRIRQRELLHELVDNSRAGRPARLSRDAGAERQTVVAPPVGGWRQVAESEERRP